MAILSNGWYQGSIPFYEITEVAIAPTGSGIESWDGSLVQDGSILCYRTGTKVTIVCSNITEICERAFFKFIALKKISGICNVTTIGASAFCYTPNIEYIDLVPGKLTSIGASAFRMSSVEDVVDLSGVSLSIVGDMATRHKRWSASGLAAVRNVAFPRTVYFDVPNPDNQQNYADVPYGTENGTLLYANDGCSALACYHVWNCMNRGTSKEYANWLDWYNATINDDGKFAEVNKFDAQMYPTIFSKLGWSGGTKTKVSDSQQLQSIIDNLVNGVPTIVSIRSVNTNGAHAVIIIGCDSETHKLAVVDSNVVGTSGTISWIAFEDIFIEGASDSDGYYQINYNRPVLAPNSTWFTQGGTSVQRSTITEIFIEDSYEPTGSVTASWDASAAKDGSIMAYVEGTKLTLSGNGSGKIAMNSDSSYLFSDCNRSEYFTNLTEIHNLNLLDASRATTLLRMCEDCFALRRFNASNWNTSNLTSLNSTFQGCTGLAELMIRQWDVQNVTDMSRFINMYGSLWNHEMKSLDLSGWNVEKVTTILQGITRLADLQELNLTGWKLSSCTNYQKCLVQLLSIRELDLSGFDTLASTDMTNMFYSQRNLQKITLGENFRFTGDGTLTGGKVAVLPTPNSEYITGADGNWYTQHRTSYAPADIPDRTAQTYYASLDIVNNLDFLVKNGSLLDVADKIRVLNGTTEAMGLEAMKTNLGEANDEVNTQANLIAQIQAAVDNLPEAGSGGTDSGTTMISVTISSSAVSSSYYINASGELAIANASGGTIETLNGIIMYNGTYRLKPLSGDYIYSEIYPYKLIKFNSSGGSFTVVNSGGSD